MKLLIFFLTLILIICITFRKDGFLNEENYSRRYNLEQNENGKLLVKDQIIVKINNDNIPIKNVELDTGSSNIILDKNTSDEILKNKPKFLCTRGEWGKDCERYSYESNFSGKKILSNFYNGNISLLNTNVNNIGIGSTNKNIKEYTIFGLSHSNDNKLNYLGNLDDSFKKFTFKFGNLENNEGGEFYFGVPKPSNYISYEPNNRNKYLLKVDSITVNDKQLDITQPYHASIDSGAENFTLSSKDWKFVGSPDYGNVSITFTDSSGKKHTLKNKTPMREYNPNKVELDNSIETPYILVGKFLLQNNETTFDIPNNRIGFKF
jgi:hypothetical protein